MGQGFREGDEGDCLGKGALILRVSGRFEGVCMEIEDDNVPHRGNW